MGLRVYGLGLKGWGYRYGSFEGSIFWIPAGLVKSPKWLPRAAGRGPEAAAPAQVQTFNKV